ncbi:hypothetical protein DYB25_003805, partial [Aphanomyces astaci]
MNPLLPPGPADLKELTSRCIDRSYDSLYNLTTSLPNTASEERRGVALKQLQDTHAVFKKLLVLTRWSVQSPLADKCAELLQEAQTFQDQANETNDRLYFLHRDLDRAKERQYDLTTAIDVLYGGTYTRLPRVINYAMHPREFPPVDEETSIAELDAVLRFRLIEETIPDKFTHIDVHEGFVTAGASGEFEMVFTVDGTKPDSLWLVASVQTVLTDPVAQATFKHLASTSSLRIIQSNAPTDVHYMQLKILIQKRLNQSATPLLDACNIMSDFCCSLALRILHAQGQLLVDTRWPHGVSFLHQDHNDAATLDIVYWTDATAPYVAASTPGTFSLEEMRNRMHPDALRYPAAGCCVRLQPNTTNDKTAAGLFSLQLFPAPPSMLLQRYPALVPEALAVPTNLYGLSADHFLLGAMDVHAASALFCLEQHLLVQTNTDQDYDDGAELRWLTTGERVRVTRSSPRNMRLARVDSSGRAPLEVSWDMRTGRFGAFCLAQASSIAAAVAHLETLLHTTVKVQLPGVTVAGEFALVFASNDDVAAAVAAVLRLVVAFELEAFASGCANLPVVRVRDRHAAAVDAAGVASDAVFVELVRGKDATVYLVVELDTIPEVTLDKARKRRRRCRRRDSDGLFSLGPPAFSILHVVDETHRPSASSSSVRCLERLPTPGYVGTKKRKRRDVPSLSALLLDMAAVGRQRAQWHLLDAFATKYNVLLTTTSTLSTTDDGSVELASTPPSSSLWTVSCPFPDRLHTAPHVDVHRLEARVFPDSSVEVTVHVGSSPFAYISPQGCLSGGRGGGRGSFVATALPTGDLVYRRRWTNQKFQLLLMDVVVANVMLHVKPMAELGHRLERTLLSSLNADGVGQIYAERADPFKFTLACRGLPRCQSSSQSLLICDDVIMRVHVEHKVMHQYPRGAFVLTTAPSHALLPFLQDALNTHKSTAQLVEVLERTAVPLVMLSRALTAAYPAAVVPSNFVLVPRSQTHLRLTAAVDQGLAVEMLLDQVYYDQRAFHDVHARLSDANRWECAVCAFSNVAMKPTCSLCGGLKDSHFLEHALDEIDYALLTDRPRSRSYRDAFLTPLSSSSLSMRSSKMTLLNTFHRMSSFFFHKLVAPDDLNPRQRSARMRKEWVRKLDAKDRPYWKRRILDATRVVPAFVVQLMSSSDRLKALAVIRRRTSTVLGTLDEEDTIVVLEDKGLHHVDDDVAMLHDDGDDEDVKHIMYLPVEAVHATRSVLGEAVDPA